MTWVSIAPQNLKTKALHHFTVFTFQIGIEEEFQFSLGGASVEFTMDERECKLPYTLHCPQVLTVVCFSGSVMLSSLRTVCPSQKNV